MTLEQRSMALFRENGFVVGSTVKRKTFPNRKKRPCVVCGQTPQFSVSVDLWNCFDFVAVKPVEPCGIVWVQTTSASNHAMRKTKILTSPEARFCLKAGSSICIQSWAKKSNRWQARDEWITLDMFPRSLPATVADFYEDQRRSKLPDVPPGSTLLREGIKDEEIAFYPPGNWRRESNHT